MQQLITTLPLFLQRRSTNAQLMVVVFLLLMMSNGCSHTQPYMRSPIPQPEPQGRLKYRVLLFSDGGAPVCNTDQHAVPTAPPCVDDPTLQALVARASAYPQQTTILFLGDNIYPEGLPDDPAEDRYVQAHQRLQAQIAVVKHSQAEGIFLPGNHDWQRGAPSGWEAVQRQEASVENAAREAKVSFLPRGGHPGPEVVEKDGLRLVILDTQWWLHDADHKPQDTPPGMIEKLRVAINTAPESDVMVVAHHPLKSYGPHGGFFDWQDHLFPLTAASKYLWLPLPILGSLYPPGRRYLWRDAQDLYSAENRDLVTKLTTTLRTKKPLIYASGHEHSLQVLTGNDVAHYLLVSGAGSKTTKVSHGPETLFAHAHHGFMEVDFFLDGSVVLRVVEPQDGTTAEHIVFTQWLRAP